MPSIAELLQQHRKSIHGKNDPPPPLLCSYAGLLQIDGRVNRSIHWTDVCLGKNPNFAPAHFIKSMALLTKGDYQEGFRLFEYRFEVYKQLAHDNNPQWDGSITHKTVLIWAEGGFGDTIMFSRYFTEAARRCPQAVFAVQPKILDLLAKNFPWCHFKPLVVDEIATGKYDLQCSTQSLPHVLKMYRTIGVAYLRAFSAEAWKERLTDKPKIGFCWRGNPKHEQDTRRSLDSDREAVQEFIYRHDMLALVPEMMPNVKDWSDTAGIIANLDLVISADTAVAHLAAAMGVPTWLLVAIGNDWRWGEAGDRTCWYNAIRIFRCKQHYAWRALLDDVSMTLLRR